MDNVFLDSFINELEKQAGIKFLTKKIKIPNLTKSIERRIIDIVRGPKTQKLIQGTTQKTTQQIQKGIEESITKSMEASLKAMKPKINKMTGKAILGAGAGGTAAGAGFYGMKKLLNPKKNEQDFLTKLY